MISLPSQTDHLKKIYLSLITLCERCNIAHNYFDLIDIGDFILVCREVKSVLIGQCLSVRLTFACKLDFCLFIDRARHPKASFKKRILFFFISIIFN